MSTVEGRANGVAAELTRLLPSDAAVATSGRAYEASCALWNGAVSHRPAAVLACSQVSDVQAGVRAARELGLPLSVRGGGHGWTGAALADGGLTLDLSPLRDVRVDPRTAVADVRGVATSGDVARAAHRHGLIAVTGTVDAVGMAGLSLGGGYGPLSGRFGLAVDNVVGVDLVLADGSLRTADAEHDPELFWALRGGGGNFGVVTAVRVALHRVPSLLTGMIMYPRAQAEQVLRALGPELLHGPDELTTQTGFIIGPAGEPMLFVAPTWCGEPADGERALPRLAGLGEPLFAQFGPAVLPEMLAQTGAMFPPGRHVEIRPRTVAGLGPEVRRALLDGGAAMTSRLSGISLHSLHGAAGRVPAGETAFGPRTPHLLVENIAIWEPADPDPGRHRSWARDLSAALAEFSLPGGYPNLLASDETGQIAHAYDPHGDRLLAVKRDVDPDSVFSATPLPEPAGQPGS